MASMSVESKCFPWDLVLKIRQKLEILIILNKINMNYLLNFLSLSLSLLPFLYFSAVRIDVILVD